MAHSRSTEQAAKAGQVGARGDEEARARAGKAIKELGGGEGGARDRRAMLPDCWWMPQLAGAAGFYRRAPVHPRVEIRARPGSERDSPPFHPPCLCQAKEASY